MAKKPSFFEKLTGTNWEESEKKSSKKKSSEDKSIIEEKAPKAKKVKPVKKSISEKK